MLHYSKVLLILIVLGHSILPAQPAMGDANARQVTTITLAGEQIEVSLPFAAAGFITSSPDDAIQIATAVRWAPFFEVSLQAEPVPSLSEGQTESRPALAAERLNSLRSLRSEQSAVPLRPHRIMFFGQAIEGASNRVMIHLQPDAKDPVVIHEWAARSGGHVWTFRVSYTPGQNFDEELLEQISIRSAGPARQETAPDLAALQTGAGAVLAGAADLPAPGWWDGDCDTNRYKEAAGIPAYPLGGSYRGVKACGPRPWYDNAPDVLVRFFPGAWGEYEWECVELSMRYLYLAYNIAPYPGNGKDVVANYPGTLLVKVSNGSWRKPQPGDVLSYGPTTAFGHTSVVSASNIDLNGNGTITVIEQNSSATGVKTLTVVNWYVQSPMTVSGWLHDPANDPLLPGKMYLPLIMTIN